MTRDDIIRMAKEAGYGTAFYCNERPPSTEEIWGGNAETEKLRRFAEMIVAAEREACAVACENSAARYRLLADSKLVTPHGKTLHEGMWGGATNCAVAIRARGQQ